jgi:type II secretory pathway component PulC
MVAPMRLGLLLLFVLVAPSSAAEKTRPVKVIEGQLSRVALKKVMERGPQRFVAGVRVSPHLVEGRFVGFRIDGFSSDGPLVNGRHILPGDVVVRVNQEPIERPEQFMRAWDVVRGADALDVELLRGGQSLRYVWKIIP